MEQIVHGIHFCPIVAGNIGVVQFEIVLENELNQRILIPLVIDAVLDSP